MAEYIERKALEGSFGAAAKAYLGKEDLPFDKKSVLAGMSIAAGIVHTVPAADVTPVVHSRFVNMGGFPACENCGASPGTHEPKSDNPSGFPPYCYACGAKMDKESRGNEEI